MKSTRVHLILLAVLVTLSAGCGSAVESPDAPGTELSGLLDVRGSDTMVNLGAALAEAYMDINAGVDVVVQGGGSGTGIAALLNGNADIAQSSRAMATEEWALAEEKGLQVEEIAIARDAIVVCVHPDNPVQALSLEELGAIYRGEITNWSEVGGRDSEIVVLSRDTTSGTFVFFREAVVRQDGFLPDAEFTTQAMFAPSTQFIVDETAQNVHAVGYIGLGYLDDTVKAVDLLTGESSIPVSSTTAHPEGASYPLARPLFFYVVGELEGLVGDYVDFVLSPAGQQLVRDLHFLSLSE